MRNSFIILVSLLLSSCVWFDVCETVKQGEFRFQSPDVTGPRRTVVRPRFQGSPPAPQCAHLYNVDRHREWAECMGVGYK